MDAKKKIVNTVVGLLHKNKVTLPQGHQRKYSRNPNFGFR